MALKRRHHLFLGTLGVSTPSADIPPHFLPSGGGYGPPTAPTIFRGGPQPLIWGRELPQHLLLVWGSSYIPGKGFLGMPPSLQQTGASLDVSRRATGRGSNEKIGGRRAG